MEKKKANHEVGQVNRLLGEIIQQTNWMFCHGTSDGMVYSGNQPSPTEYAHRQPPPELWSDKIKYCLNNSGTVGVSVGRIIPGDIETAKDLWSPIGLLLTDGIVVGTGGHIQGLTDI